MLSRGTLTIKWVFYAAATLLLALVQTFVCRCICVNGTVPFLLPLLAAVVVTLEGPLQGMIYALCLGFAADVCIYAPIPCLYTLAFAIGALGVAKVAESLIRPGFFCSLFSSALMLLLSDGLCAFILWTKHHSGGAAMPLTMLWSLALSLPFLALIHPLFSAIHRKFVF